MHAEQMKSVIRYWEWRRLIFNALLFAAAWLGWTISNAFNAGIDEIPGARLSDPGVIGRFIVMFVILMSLFAPAMLLSSLLAARGNSGPLHSARSYLWRFA